MRPSATGRSRCTAAWRSARCSATSCSTTTTSTGCGSRRPRWRSSPAAIGLFTHEVIALDRETAVGHARPPLISRAALAPGHRAVPRAHRPRRVHRVRAALREARSAWRTPARVFLVYGCLILAVRILGARVPDRIGPLKAGTIATATAAVGLVDHGRRSPSRRACTRARSSSRSGCRSSTRPC